MWVLIGALLVFFMQAGFAMVEAGFTRAKNAGNIIMKNLMDFSLGTIVYWLIGFGIMFAGSGALIGGLDFFIRGNYDTTFPTYTFVIFQTVFCATAATIVSGAMAERTKFVSYIIYSIVISALIYPISGHWIWGGGWLAQLGFHDFAGSTAVHMVGGVAALVGAKILGPRIGKYGKDGKANAIPGHNLTIGALGVFILWFAWFGFNGGSTTSMTGDDTLITVGSVFVTTNLSAATASAAVMIITWIRYKKPDVSMTLNGALAGLVGITAGADAVNPFGAFWIGLISGVVVVFAVEFIDKVLKIDDPVGAASVHGVCGAVGTLCVGLFAVDGGLFYGGGAHLLGVQAIGVVSVIAWVGVTMTILFIIIKKTIGLRVSEEEELIGLDSCEHGLTSSYADFMPIYDVQAPLAAQPGAVESAPIDTPATASEKSADKMTKVSIIANQDQFPVLQAALEGIGVTGLTVKNVLGHGIQKGHPEYYRGAPVKSLLLPKVQVDVVICKIPTKTLIDTVKNALYTGNVGDGKIFVYDVENIIKIRTGEEGGAALRDE